MKILLINTGRKFFQPNLGLGYLAAFVKAKNPEARVAIADENVCQSACKIARSFKPDIVGFTATTSYFSRVVNIASNMRKLLPEALFMLGGIHITALPDSLPEAFDLGVAGEGEIIFNDIVKNHKDYKGQRAILRGETIAELDTLPFPERDLFSMSYYAAPNQTIRGYYGRSTQIMSSRGCPYDCSFCGNAVMWGCKTRYFSADYLIAELEMIVKKYNLTSIFVQDDIFVLNKKRMQQFVELKNKSNILRKIIYSAQMRPNNTSESDILLLKESGCVQVEFGFESGSDPILKSLKGPTASVEKNLEAAELAKKHGMRVLGTWVMGEPAESEEDMLATIDFIKKAPIDFGCCFMLIPYPGTRLWESVPDSAKTDWDKFNMTRQSGYSLMPRAVPEERLLQLLAEANHAAASKSVVKSIGFSPALLVEKSVKRILGNDWEKYLPYCIPVRIKQLQSRLAKSR